MHHWLVKTEPTAYSIDDLARDKRAMWDGIRNYQARNFIRDQMSVEDPVLVYHSNADPTGIVGLARVCAPAHADATALDKKDVHFDPKATRENPIWMAVDLQFVEKFSQPVTLAQLRATAALAGMLVLKRAQRLSVMPVEPVHFQLVVKMARGR